VSALGTAVIESLAAGSERFFVVISQVFLDGSWPGDGSGCMAFGALAARQDPLIEFHLRWSALLDEYGLPALHMTELMSFRGPFNALAAEWGDDRDAKRNALLSRFADVLCGSPQWAPSCMVADIETFSAKTRQAKKVELFQSLVRRILLHAPAGDTIFLLCDEEQDVDRDYLGWLRNLKLQDSKIRRQVVGISFVDDEVVLPIQAADMIAWVVRDERERQLYRPSELVNPSWSKLEARFSHSEQGFIRPGSGFPVE
jgi:hypothetical protein